MNESPISKVPQSLCFKEFSMFYFYVSFFYDFIYFPLSSSCMHIKHKRNKKINKIHKKNKET